MRVKVDFKTNNATPNKAINSTSVAVALRLDNKDYIVKLLRQDFVHQFDNTSYIQLSRQNKDRILEICKSVKLLGRYQCENLHISLRKIMVNTMCTNAITHVCVGGSCAPFQDGPMTLDVTLHETGVHWLEAIPVYRHPACSFDRDEHSINLPMLRIIVVDCNCPFVFHA